MAKPVVAIVGRPNVGKSTFFNTIVGKRIAIEEDTPGVTRDRISADAYWLKYDFTLIDTGGLDPEAPDKMTKQIRRQAEIAMDIADVILFMVDAKDGVLGHDRLVADIIRKTKKPVLLVVNKVDHLKYKDNILEFYELGFEPIGISSVNRLNLGDLLDRVVELFPERTEEDQNSNEIKIAITGRPNVGKSSLLNQLIGEERVIVSDIAGTTRDAIDVLVTRNGKNYRYIDTAGIRKKKKVVDDIEHYSVLRAFSAIERSDVVILMVDAAQGFAEQDKKIIGHAHNEGKSIIVLLNKWDLIEKDNHTYSEYKKTFYNEFGFLKYAMFEAISVLENQRVSKILELVDTAYENRNRRITTGALNDVISEAVLRNVTPNDKGNRLNVFYMTQIDVAPPKFLLFINSKKYLHFSYVRYLENVIRSRYDFSGTPIIIDVKERKSK